MASEPRSDPPVPFLLSSPLLIVCAAIDHIRLPSRQRLPSTSTSARKAAIQCHALRNVHGPRHTIPRSALSLHPMPFDALRSLQSMPAPAMATHAHGRARARHSSLFHRWSPGRRRRKAVGASAVERRVHRRVSCHGRRRCNHSAGRRRRRRPARRRRRDTVRHTWHWRIRSLRYHTPAPVLSWSPHAHARHGLGNAAHALWPCGGRKGVGCIMSGLCVSLAQAQAWEMRRAIRGFRVYGLGLELGVGL